MRDRTRSETRSRERSSRVDRGSSERVRGSASATRQRGRHEEADRRGWEAKTPDKSPETPSSSIATADIAPDLQAQVATTCERAQDALRSRDPDAAAKVFDRVVQPKIGGFHEGAVQSLYCCLSITYTVGNALRRHYGLGTRPPMFKRLLGDVKASKIYLGLLKRSVKLPEEEARRKLVLNRLSDYNCALEQAFREKLEPEELVRRLAEEGGIGGLLQLGRAFKSGKQNPTDVDAEPDFFETERGGRRVGDGARAADDADAVSASGAPESDGAVSDTASPNAFGARWRRTDPSSTAAIFGLSDEAEQVVRRGRGRHVAIVTLTHAVPPHVDIEAMRALPDHRFDDDVEALCDMVRFATPKKDRLK